jgi:hypothetical protein
MPVAKPPKAATSNLRRVVGVRDPAGRDEGPRLKPALGGKVAKLDRDLPGRKQMSLNRRSDILTRRTSLPIERVQDPVGADFGDDAIDDGIGQRGAAAVAAAFV